MSDIIRVRCGGCDVKLKAPLKYQGRQINCPQCGQEVRIPYLDAARPSVFDSATSATRSSAVAPVLLAPGKESPKRQEPAKPVFGSEERATVLGDDAFIDSKPAARKPADDEFGNIDFADYEDYGNVEDYGAPARPRRNSAPAPVRKRKKRKPVKSRGDSVVDPSIIGGIVMMVGAVVWFVVGLKFGIIFFYPPVLFVLGIAAFVKGLLD
jgi:hypothetical protein